VMELRVVAYTGTDQSMNPANFKPGLQKMIPLPISRTDPRLNTARHRTFGFDRSGGTDEAPWTIKTDGDEALNMDPRRISAAPQLATGPTQPGFVGTNGAGNDTTGTFEIWTIDGNGGWSHPVHIHFEEGIILERDGEPPPAWEKWARKDVYRIGPEDDASNDLVIAIRFREFAGSYMEHCHNTQHEDHSMLLRWDLEHPGQTKLMPAPIPTWDGVEYVDSAALPTFRTGDGFGLDP
jgi:manganese oxidase